MRSPRLLVLAVLALTAAVAASSSLAAPAKTVTVTATDFKFTGIPKTIGPGSHTFRLVNRGHATHDLKLAGRKTRLLNRGQSASLTVKLKKGRYAYLCTVPGHAALGMKGTLIVK
jgi:plastocyanin